MSEPYWSALGGTPGPPPPATPADDGKWLQASGGAMVWTTLPVTPLRASLGLTANTITDWNNANENGWWMGNNAANAPTAGVWFIGEVNVHIQNLWMVQRVYNFTDIVGSQVYERRMANGTWTPWVQIPAGFGTALPTVPLTDGYEFTLTDSVSAGTYQWKFRYCPARGTNKWVFVGGSPVTKVIATDETTSSGTFADLATVGPTFTMPVAGQYDFVYSCATNNTGGNDNQLGLVKAGVAQVQAYAEFAGATSRWGTMAGQWLMSCAASDVVKLQYACASGPAHYSNRVLRITPIAVGG